jgi:tRNA A-37 threonylcarbamoyl transferase component Bud32
MRCRIALVPLLLASAAGTAVAEPKGRGRDWNPIEIRVRVPGAEEIKRAARNAWERIEDAPGSVRPEAEPRPTARRERAATAPIAPPAPDLGPEFEPSFEPRVETRIEPPPPAATAPEPATAIGAPAAVRDARLTASRALRAAIGLGLLALLLALPLLVRRRRAPELEPALHPSGAPTLPRATATTLPRATAATLPRVAVAQAVDAALAADAAPAVTPAGGRYEIQAELGRGGMGVVYRARDTRLDRVVALKRLPDHLRKEERFVEMLLREARSAARLNHRNIVTVYDVDHEDGSWFITMELLEGSSLGDIVRQRGRMTVRSALWVAEQALAGLGYAHERGVIHRDVKPANLFVTRDKTLKLMDFGLARIAEEARRKRTLIGGTPDYMAPEQTTGASVDARADLYALGASLFELLTGQVPFTEGDLLHHHRETPAPDPRAHADGVPDALAELVLALLAKEPEARPASAVLALERIRAIGASLPKPA